MELYLDNDIILKLSSIKKLHLIEKIFQANSKSIFVLPSVPYYFRKKTLLNTYSQETIDCSISETSGYSKITDQVDKNDLALLSNIQDIDSGEQVLFSICPQDDFLILTGDKKSLIEVNGNPKLDSIKNKLQNRIVCFESIMLLLTEIEDFPSLCKEIKKSNYCSDKTIELIFKQNDVDFIKAKEGLVSYLNDLKQNTGQLIFTSK